ncbi:aromatase/cyclase [Streptomyces sp. DSM 42041]|uniref:Aromatase/cyclase n=1 Tax=Streptomyces hazeniae TaxID=3075538 RepID=A0ABU2NU79_9ACTN|nr:aromatase/cyclase [Streptomyces sp. DSM 42041]MDT0380548.1 aromatase/cyclase [Streptomyces sp. DSM 42041]
MPQVTVHALAPGLTPDVAYDRLRDFGSYPKLTDTVQEVTVHQEPGGSQLSDWTVHFRDGLMAWQERDHFDPGERTIAFRQVKGDFETFEGSWTCTPGQHGDGTLVTFEADFDLGIPTLAALLDPVAESALRENIALILKGLVGAESVGEPVGATHE